jgi:hypothetical protein
VSLGASVRVGSRTIEVSAPGGPLRVGLMLNSFDVPAWIAKIVGQLSDADFIDVRLIILNEERPPPRPRFARLRSPRRQRLLFNLYRLIDARLFATEPNAFAHRNIEDQLAGVPVLSVTPSRPRPFEHRFPKAATDEIRRANLDVILRFGFNIIRGEILECARFGVWSYHHGDNREYRGGPDFFWEMYEGNPVTGTILQVLTDELDAGGILYRSFSATHPTSLHRGRNQAYWKSSEFVLRCLTGLHRDGWERLQTAPIYRDSGGYAKPIYRTPTNRQMLRFGARLLSRMAVRRVDRLLFSTLWYVAYRRLPRGAATLPTSSPRTTRFRRIHMPTGRYYADPCVVVHDDGCYVFFEDYDIGGAHGVISVARLDGDGAPRSSLALRRDYHLSYPFVFRWGSDWYMLPETFQQRSVELYRAVRFPDQWTLERVLLSDVNAVDPTLVEYEGRFWLFVGVAVPGASTWDELSLFYADSLSGEWHAHPENPIVSDVRCARPAGRVVEAGGSLVRPAQDSSGGYGRAIVFNRITRLTPSEYEEEAIGRLQPKRTWRAIGTHTYNAVDGWEVVDGQRRWLARRA